MAFYYLLLRPWTHWKDTEAWVRLPSVIASVACIPVVYAIGTRISSRWTGAAAALLLALNVTHIAYAQEARSYSLVMLLCLISLLLFLRIPTQAKGNAIAYAVFSALAVYTHFFAVFYLFAEWISILTWRKSELPWKNFLGAMALTAVLISPALYYMAFHHAGHFAVLSPVGLHDISNLIYFMAADEGKFRKALALVYLVCCALTARGIYVRCRRRDKGGWGLVVTFFCALLPIAITLLISVWFPIYFPRYVLVSLPAIVLVVAAGFVELRPAWLQALVAFLIVVATAGCLRWYYAQPKDDWRSLTAHLVSEAQTDDTIVGVPAGAEWPLQYYAAHLRPSKKAFQYLTANSLLRAIEIGQDEPRRFWVVTWGENLPQADGIAREVAPAYKRVETQEFHGPLTLTLYESSAAGSP